MCEIDEVDEKVNAVHSLSRLVCELGVLENIWQVLGRLWCTRCLAMSFCVVLLVFLVVLLMVCFALAEEDGSLNAVKRSQEHRVFKNKMLFFINDFCFIPECVQ